MEGCERWMRRGAEVGIKVLLCGGWWRRSPCGGCGGGGCLDICVTREHDRKLAEMKKNHLAFEGVLDEFSSSQHVGRGNTSTDLWSWWFPSTQFTVLKSDTLILISIWSLPTSCLMLMAIRVTRAHTGDYLITLVLLTPINNPSRAIIHVAILINTIMRTAAKLDLDEVSSSLRGSVFFIGSSLLSVCCLNRMFISCTNTSKYGIGNQKTVFDLSNNRKWNVSQLTCVQRFRPRQTVL